MRKILPETKVRLRCDFCNVTEFIRFEDFEKSPGGSFFVVPQYHCKCSGTVIAEIREEDQE